MRTLHLFRYVADISGTQVDSLVIFNSADNLSAEELDKTVQEELKKNLTPDRVLLLVRDNIYKAVVEQIGGGSRFDFALNRLSRASVSIASFGSNGEKLNQTTIHGNISFSEPEFDSIKLRACTSIFRIRDGFVRSTPAFHFRNPSDRHTDQFIRLSNILVAWPEISFWALCTLPHIPADVEVAYVDTPALFSLVDAINDHWRAIGITRRLSTDCFGSYSGLADYEFSRASEAVVLISASSSGGLATKLSSQNPMISADRVVHIAFLGTGVAHQNVVCDLSFDPIKNPEGFKPIIGDYHSGSCPLCLAGSVAIPLEGEQFDIAGPQPTALLINANDCARDLPRTMERLAGSRTLRVGLAAPNSALPRQFYISPSALTENKNISERIDYIIARSVPAHTAIVVSLNAGSNALAERIRDSLPRSCQPRIITFDELRRISRSENPKPVIVAAAVIESGRSLLDISRELRSSYPVSPQIYIIGLAKYLTETKYNNLRSTIVRGNDIQPHEFRAAERLMLPPSSIQNVWTKELELWEELINSGKMVEMGDGEATATLTQRHEILTATNEPLCDNLFLNAAGGSKLAVQHGFAFWPAHLPSKNPSQADVYFTMCSVLQSLRANADSPGARALRSGRLQQTLLDPANFGRFNDGVIQASLLRGAFPHELNYGSSPNLSSEMGRIIRRLIESSNRPRGEAAPEFLVALAVKQLILMREDLKGVLSPCPEAPPVIQALIQICLRATKK